MQTDPAPPASDDQALARPKMKLGSMFGEILPLASFFIVNQSYGLYMAAVAAIATSALLIVIYRIREKRLARFVVFSTLVYAVLTAAAIFTEEKTYIKIQPSLFSFCFAAVLLGGVLRGRAMMKVFFKTQFTLSDRVWWLLSLRWGLFFLAAGLANEMAWRALSDDDWVLFRVLVMAPATGLFMLAQLPLTFRGMREFKAQEKADLAA